MSESPVDPSTADGKLPDTDTPPDAINLNVGGRELTGPNQGFGQLWRKVYRVRLVGAEHTPEDVIRRWKVRFSDYWPEGSDFYGSRPRIEQGEVAVINIEGPGGAPLATGVAVIHADDRSFAFMTPQGHIFAGTITFTAYRDEPPAPGVTVAQIESIIRAGDPLFEIGARLGIVHRREDTFWQQTLARLAADFGVHGQPIEMESTLLDRHVRWRAAPNVWHNSAIRTTLYLPIHALRRLLGQTRRADHSDG
ncbi:MAG: hypothetical protein KBG73_08135 [Candidatus Promineofilum sp.]|nr:hypothetical protein [Promineifilum sp.]